MEQLKRAKKEMGDRAKLVVLGGGAAGMMAALAAAEMQPGSVMILEKNDRLGRKLLATGNGKCNLSNRFCTGEDFDGLSLRRVPEFAQTVLDQLPVEETLKLFERIGVPAREEGDGRLYPYSLQAASVRDALEWALRERGVSIRTSCTVVELTRVESIREELNREVLDREGIGGFALKTAEGVTILADRVILTTGGSAGGQYGSAGDGFELAKRLGHRIVPVTPALVQLECESEHGQELSGVRMRGRVTLIRGKKRIAEELGEIQFTAHGLSGICVFDLSRNLRGDSGELKNGPYAVEVDLCPEFTEKKLLELLRRRKEDLAGRPMSTFLDGMIPGKLCAALLSETGCVGGHRKGSGPRLIGDLTFETLKELGVRMKHWRFPVTGKRPWNEAQVTAGGVDVSEICAETLESAKVPGLYFAGELADVDGRCGGFNLQWAWSSGFAAGQAAVR